MCIYSFYIILSHVKSCNHLCKQEELFYHGKYIPSGYSHTYSPSVPFLAITNLFNLYKYNDFKNIILMKPYDKDL